MILKLYELIDIDKNNILNMKFECQMYRIYYNMKHL